MLELPFAQRFGFETEKPVTDDFPEKARVGLAYLLKDLRTRNYVADWSDLCDELCRLEGVVADRNSTPGLALTVVLLEHMEWCRVYGFCERIYSKLLQPDGYWDSSRGEDVEITSLAEVRTYYHDELSNLLDENNIGYEFVAGQFQHRGRAQTQKSIQRVGAVLVQSRLGRVRQHFNKARKFFDERPEPDTENCVKEAVCALEAAVGILTKKPASKGFTRAVRQLQGSGPGQIPPPIAVGMIKLHAYRGTAQGVAHAALQGSNVSEIEAELVLSLVASYVTYLADLFPERVQEIPF